MLITGDGAFIKQINRRILLENILKHEQISRAELSKITGLNKATVSAQVADLLEEELIIETEKEHHAVGRRPIMLSINPKAGYVLGIDLDYRVINYTICNLAGVPIEQKSVQLETENYEAIISKLVKQIREYQNSYAESRYGLISVTIAVHGTVHENESVYYIPKYHWTNKQLKNDLQNHLNIDIYIENNANLTALAEKVYHYHQTEHLVSITFTSGIGTGTMIGGKIYRGYHGHAGELGHMIIRIDGEPCSCGNRGCWELYASEYKLLRDLSDFFNKNITVSDVKELLEKEDEMIINKINDLIYYIAIGLNNVINIFNPEVIVLNSEILNTYPNSIQKIKENLNSSVSQECEIELSKLGCEALLLGACALSIQKFLNIKEPQLTLPEKTPVPE